MADIEQLVTEAEPFSVEVEFEISLNGKSLGSKRVKVVSDSASAHAKFLIQCPEWWYPTTYGKQPLYTLAAVLLSNGITVDTVSKRLGLREVRLNQVQLQDEPGTSFYFTINDIPIFCGGSNWIPADNFIPRPTRQDYRDWVRLAVDGNQVMLRVWGGGIYEEEHFYEACDELGILVWQDFMFSCGNYPADEHFLALCKREAVENVKRLRHHPCIVVWAGNNEDYQIAESQKLEYNPEDQNQENWLRSSFPARYIYEKLLADVCKDLIPDTPYHFGSPFGGKHTRDSTAGDIHQWNGEIPQVFSSPYHLPSPLSSSITFSICLSPTSSHH